jgi:glycine C-acetyltransferase
MMKDNAFTLSFEFSVVPEGSARIRLQISDALDYEDLDKALGENGRAFKEEDLF